MDGISFGQQIQTCLRASGHSQHHLADELGLHPGVLNCKLRAKGNAYLNQLEVKRIILTLINWNAISTHDEVVQFLELANLRPSSFTADEWQSRPLSMLVPGYVPSKHKWACQHCACSSQPARASDASHWKDMACGTLAAVA